ncbi:MAG: hypothetical protein AAF682_07910 [Planctomycetota bacterium]
MTEAIRASIESADADALRSLVEADPRLADADVAWGEGGKNVVPPLHFVCDAVFRGLADQEQALAMADVLLAAGVDPARAYAKSGDTFLIAAASLGAQSVGLRLVARGVDVGARGLFGATALHWSAIMGLDRLAGALLAAGAELELLDEQYDCTPLQWALHGWSEGTNGDRDGIPRVARVLVGAGARVPAGAVDGLTGAADAALRDALAGAP